MPSLLRFELDVADTLTFSFFGFLASRLLAPVPLDIFVLLIRPYAANAARVDAGGGQRSLKIQERCSQKAAGGRVFCNLGAQTCIHNVGLRARFSKGGWFCGWSSPHTMPNLRFGSARTAPTR